MAIGIPLLISMAVTAGGMAAQYLLMPRQKPKPIDVGKMDDPRVTGSEYGAYIPRWWGTARVAGNVIWSNGVDHTILDYPSEGGKGAPATPGLRVHTYTSSLGLLLGRSRVNEWGRIWADEDLIVGKVGQNVKTFQAEDDEVATPAGEEGENWIYDVVSGQTIGIAIRKGFGIDGELAFDVTSCELPPLPPSNDPFEGDSNVVSPRTKVTLKYRNARTLDIRIIGDTGAGVTQNDYRIAPATTATIRVNVFDGDLETYTVVNQTFSGQAVDEFLRIDSITVEKYWDTVDAAQGNKYMGSVTGIIDPDVVYASDAEDISGYYSFVPQADAEGTTAIAKALVAESFKLYSGTETQLQDSELIAYLDTRYGAGEGQYFAPGHRGLSWISFRNYGLRRGRVPNFTVEVTNDISDVNQILTDLAEDVGLEASDLNLTDTVGLEVYGYVESQTTSRKSHYDSLSQFFGFYYAEIDGKITTILDKEIKTINPPPFLDEDILRAASDRESSTPYSLEMRIVDAYDLPGEVRYTFSNPDMDYLKETAIATLNGAPSNTDVVDQSFSIVSTQEQARKRAAFRLMKIHSETKTVNFKALPELAQFSVGDLLRYNIPISDDSTDEFNYWLRIDRKRMTMPLGVVDVEATLITPYALEDIDSSIATSQASNLASIQTAFVQAPRNAVAVPIISQPIRESDRGRLGVYIAVSPFGNGVSETTVLYQEIADETYNIREIYEVPSVVGIALDALGDWATPSSEDTTNYIDIYFFNEQTLESVSSGELDRNPQLNLLRVGDEWIQFRTAALQSLDPASVYRSKWRVSNLRRGLFGTASAIDAHEANEYCVLNTNNLRFYDLTQADIGEEVTFVAVSGGGNIELSPKATFVFTPISAYTITNANDDRAFDADCTTIDELADVVATIVKDTNI